MPLNTSTVSYVEQDNHSSNQEPYDQVEKCPTDFDDFILSFT